MKSYFLFFNINSTVAMEQANIFELPDSVSGEEGDDAEKSSHIATSSPPVVSPPAENWFAWLQVLGAFSYIESRQLLLMPDGSTQGSHERIWSIPDILPA
jgi:hypothetical protein